jgi:hypothetical protein
MAFDEFEDCFVWKCDRCGCKAVFPPGNFWAALAELKSRGWEIDRDEDGWGHTCRKCRKTSAELMSMPVRRVGR